MKNDNLYTVPFVFNQLNEIIIIINTHYLDVNQGFDKQ